MSAALAQPAAIPVGLVKQIGEIGPAYEILGSAPRGPKGEWFPSHYPWR